MSQARTFWLCLLREYTTASDARKQTQREQLLRPHSGRLLQKKQPAGCWTRRGARGAQGLQQSSQTGIEIGQLHDSERAEAVRQLCSGRLLALFQNFNSWQTQPCCTPPGTMAAAHWPAV